MSELALVIVLVAAVATAALTAVAGAGGGVVLLVVMLQFVDPLVAIPAHGVVQLVSNGTRAVTLRGRAETAPLRGYLPLLLPGMVVGYFVADAIPRAGGRAIIGAFALLAVWWPAATAWLVPRGGGHRRLLLLGAGNGLLTPTIGATGPLIAPAFRTITTDHVAFVATFAVAQVVNHLAKIVVFGVAGFAFREHLPLILVATVGVVVGTRVGARFLTRFDPALLGRVFQVVVTLGALRLLLGVL